MQHFSPATVHVALYFATEFILVRVGFRVGLGSRSEEAEKAGKNTKTEKQKQKAENQNSYGSFQIQNTANSKESGQKKQIKPNGKNYMIPKTIPDPYLNPFLLDLDGKE